MPPRCSRNVRSLTLRTFTPGTARSASTISSECAASAAEQVTSTVSPSERESTTSIAVTAPPAVPTAVAMRPMLAGSPSEVSRTVIEYEAEVTGPRGDGDGLSRDGVVGAGGGRGVGAHGGGHRLTGCADADVSPRAGELSLSPRLEPGAELAERRVEVRRRPAEQPGQRAGVVLADGQHGAAVVLGVEGVGALDGRHAERQPPRQRIASRGRISVTVTGNGRVRIIVA